MKKDCPPSKVRAYKGLKYPRCGCPPCLKKYAEVIVTQDAEKAADLAVDFFWLRLGQLVHETLAIVPKEDRDDLRMRLEEQSSVYGID